MRLGIFGGSFDPIHWGHLRLAHACADQARLDNVWFVPAAQQPLKPDGPNASAENRCQMIELAIAGEPRFVLSTCEIDRGGPSFTANTLQAIHELHPDATLFFLMGADSLRDLPRWYRPDVICQLATPLVVVRPGEPAPDFRPISRFLSDAARAELDELHVEMEPTDISSTQVRQLVASGEQLTDLVPPEVAQYISREQLYRV